MALHSLSSAANSALNGLNDVLSQVDEVAQNVAAGVASDTESNFTGGIEQIARLPDLKQQAAANVRVFSAVEELFAELGSLPRL